MNADHENMQAKYRVWKDLTDAYEAHISAMWAQTAVLDDEFKDLIKRMKVAHAEFMAASKLFVR
ncbi:hypothetical protein CSQ90_26640 [Janthinobacterium sp. BJB303]|nr:hypothetical protein CSQ90_26640 [Janthinobacterium sp. BJB303]